MKNDIPEVTDEMKSIFHSAYQNKPENLQKAILALKQAEYFKIMTIVIMMSELKISLAEAKEIVDTSEAWSPR